MKSKTFYDRVAKKSKSSAESNDGEMTLEAASKLSTEELIARSKRCQREGRKIFIEWGIYLTVIRDGERFSPEYDSFYQFCLHHFGISKSYAIDLISDVPVYTKLSKPARDLIVNERQLRELKKAPEIIRNDVVETAKQYGPITASNIRESIEEVARQKKIDLTAMAVVQPPSSNGNNHISKSSQKTKTQISAKSKPEIVYDCAGGIVTDEAMPFWSRVKEIGAIISPVRDIAKEVKRLKESGDMLFARVPDSIVERLNQDYLDLRLALPYCLCPKCHGEPSLRPNGCSDCSQTGLISKVEHDRLNP